MLRLAALTAVTELAVVEAATQLAEELRGSLIEEMRAGAISGEEIVRRGQRLGADSPGVVALAAEASGGKPRYMAAIISSVAGSAIAEPLGDRVFALLPSVRRRAAPAPPPSAPGRSSAGCDRTAPPRPPPSTPTLPRPAGRSRRRS